MALRGTLFFMQGLSWACEGNYGYDCPEAGRARTLRV